MGSAVGALNGRWHELALQVYLAVVLAHWAEHILQTVEIFVLRWPRPEARGALGLAFPWLVTSEWLHYAYALFILAGLVLLRPAFQGRARVWWNISLGIQVWHHFEHALLLGQVLVQANLLGLPAPTSIAQLLVPRVELHLLYNALVLVPMLVAMYYHLYPPTDGRPVESAACTCSHRRAAQAPQPA